MIEKISEKLNKNFDWIDVENPSEEELAHIAKEYNLHPASVKDCLEPEHLPKFEQIDETSFIVLRVYDSKAKTEATSTHSLTRKLVIFNSNKTLITIHRSEQAFLNDVKLKYFDTGKCKTNYEMVARIIEFAMQSYDEPILKFSQDLDALEAKMFTRHTLPPIQRNIYLLKRKSAICLKMTQLTKDVLFKVAEKVEPTLAQDLRDIYVKHETAFLSVTENATQLMNLYLSISSQKTNEVIRVLTIFSVFFMPLTFIVGIYGMNFEVMPELTYPLGYPAIWFAMIAVTLVIYLWFKRRNWL